ncbi:uncharacterized protein LOC125277482 [Megalobrama amblycephala]|uniref:uncharacterized protein LOC125277482 n=1 Tax=Megalobrama amblycephala TaxID=75352 RepID=UPI002013C3D9|nr:uncharacterized protein LOC125277482 [Megalobrama amblycephala]XP_048061828.1 uncharacterized protein LOC125277482 [Megalobrama amblycephala]
MPSLQFLNMFGRQLTQLSIVTSVPLGFSLVGLQAIMEVKFSCPCKAGWNTAISALVFCAPALFAFVIMFVLLRPIPFKYSCCQKQNNIEDSRKSQAQDNKETSQAQDNKETSQAQDNKKTSQAQDNKKTSQAQDNKETSQAQDNKETSQAQDNKETSQAQDNKETSQAQDNKETSQAQDNKETSQAQDNKETSQAQDNKETSQAQDNKETSQAQDNKKTSQAQDNKETSQGKNEETPQEHLKQCIKCRYTTFFVCLIPSLVWICICFIDGDYLACGFTTCNGRYACDKELHPNCLNWCKPTELSPEKNETECYERTRKLIYISKITGYVLVLIFCIIAIILVTFDWDGSLPKCSNTESSTPAEPKPDKSNEGRSDNLQMRSIGSTPEERKSLLSCQQGGRGEAEKEEEEEDKEQEEVKKEGGGQERGGRKTKKC